jgi:hypothetical protein
MKRRMEIQPISGVRALGAVKAPRIESWRTSVFNIDASTKPEDGRGQGTARKAAESQDDGEEEEYDLALEEDAEPGSLKREEGPGRSVDYIA